MNERRDLQTCIDLFSKAIDQSSSILKENPDLCFSQVYNRLKSEVQDMPLLQDRLEENRSRYTRPWLRLISRRAIQTSAFVRSFSGLGTVSQCAFFSGGKKVVSAQKAGMIKVWETETGKELLTFQSPDVKRFYEWTYDWTGGFSKYLFAVDPEGKKICQVGYNGEGLVLWDTETGILLSVFLGHQLCITAFNFTPDGQFIISASLDRTIKIWDVKTSRELAMLKHEKGPAGDFVFSKDGNLLVCACYDGNLRIWDLKKFELISNFKAHEKGVRCCAISPDGKMIVSGGDDHLLKLWDFETGKELAALEGHNNTIHHCGFTPDRKRLFSLSSNETLDETLKVWNPETREELLSLTDYCGSLNHPFALSPDGKSAAVVRHKNTVVVLDLLSGKEIARIVGASECIDALSFSSDGRNILSGGYDYDLKLWSVEQAGKKAAVKSHAGLITDCCFSRNGQHVLTASSDKMLKLWNTNTLEEEVMYSGHDGKVVFCAFSPDEERIISSSFDNTLRVWDKKTGKELYAINVNTSEVQNCFFNPDGKSFISMDTNSTLKVWETESGKETLSIVSHKIGITSFSLSPDGQLIATGGLDKMLKIWEVASGKELATFKGHKGFVLGCTFSPDGKRIVSFGAPAENYETIKHCDLILWDVEKKRRILTLKLEGQYLPVLDCAFSPDGTRLITSHSDYDIIRIWDSKSGELQNTVKISGLKSFIISPDGKKIASTEPLELWDMQKGQKLTSLPGFSGRIHSFAFSPCGDKIAIGDSFGQLLLISLENIELGPTIVTPLMISTEITFLCPYCLSSCQIENSQVGKKIYCHACGKEIKLNPFILVRKG